MSVLEEQQEDESIVGDNSRSNMNENSNNVDDPEYGESIRAPLSNISNQSDPSTSKVRNQTTSVYKKDQLVSLDNDERFLYTAGKICSNKNTQNNNVTQKYV